MSDTRPPEPDPTARPDSSADQPPAPPAAPGGPGSPYSAASPAAGAPESPYSAASPAPGAPYGAAPGGYGATSSTSTLDRGAEQPPRKSGLGLASLIVGGVALLLAFVPFVNYVSGLIALVGIVLGIIALVQKNRKKGIALAGTIVSAVALILSVILAVVYTIGFASAVDDAVSDDASVIGPSDQAEDGAAPEETPEEEVVPDEGEGSADVGTRESPTPIGTTITLESGGVPEWEITTAPSTLDATASVLA